MTRTPIIGLVLAAALFGVSPAFAGDDSTTTTKTTKTVEDPAPDTITTQKKTTTTTSDPDIDAHVTTKKKTTVHDGDEKRTTTEQKTVTDE